MVSPLILSLSRQKNYYGSRIKLLSPAKINLYLNILGKYENGFHEIESIVERISLFDEISIKINKEPKIEIKSSDKNLEGDHNLCFKSAKLMKDKYSLPFGFSIFLKKKIPVGSGLGGGSSNAASTILGINALLNMRLPKEKLYKLGEQIGSDVNFFLSEAQSAFIYGRGEKIIPINSQKNHYIVIWPKISLSTKTVYQNSKVKLTKFLRNVNILIYALKKGDTFLLKKNIFNVLEKSAFSLCKELVKIKMNLIKKGVFFRITGSGSCLYTVLDQKRIPRIKDLFSKNLVVFSVKTF